MTLKKKILQPVNKTRLHEEIVEQIQKKIIHGELKMGSKLPPERELAMNLNVNRATVREAMKKLETLRLVDILHGDGIYIRDYQESDNLDLLKTILHINGDMAENLISNILELRIILVPEMASIAVKNIDQEGIEELRSIVNSKKTSVMERDLAIHKYIGKASNNLPYLFILNFFEQIFIDYGKSYFSDENNCNMSKKFHNDILEAFVQKKGSEAKSIMRDILEYTENQINNN